MIVSSIIIENPNNLYEHTQQLISTTDGRFPRARLQPRANKRFSMGRVIANGLRWDE